METVTVKTSGSALIFFSVGDHLNDDPRHRRDALRAAQVLAAEPPDRRVPVEMEVSRPGSVLPVDGLGRTVPGMATPDGRLGPDLWRRFADARPRLRLDAESWRDSAEGREPIGLPFPAWTIAGLALGDEGELRIGPTDPEEVDPLGSAEPTIPARSLPLWVDWPAPFDRLCAGGAALDALADRIRLDRVLALVAAGHEARAVALVETALAGRRSEVTLPSRGVFWQIAALHDGGESVCLEAVALLDVDLPDWERLQTDPDFLAAVRRPTTLPYLRGILGFIWWELLGALRAGYLPRRCAHCARALPPDATRRRRFCVRDDQDGCWQERHAARARRRRGGA